MLSSQFLEVFENFPNIQKVYLGCYSSDKLPKKIRINHFCIVNTDISAGSGIHWYIVVRYSKKILEVFDSLGINEDKKQFLQRNFQLDGIEEIIFNTTRFQRNDTDTCGKFVLYFVINRLYNLDHSFHDMLEELFNQDLDKNEENVSKFYEEIIAV